MTSKLKQAATERLAKQAAGDFGFGKTTADKYAAIQPDAAAYNVSAPEYAKSLASDTGYLSANILNQRALGVNAEAEAERYAAALAAANENQKYLQHAAIVAEAQGRLADHDLDTKVNPVIGAVGVDNNTGYLTYDKPAVAVVNSENLNAQHASTLKDTAAAIKDIRTSGYLIPEATVGSMISPAGQETPTPVQENLTPIRLDNGQVVQMLPNEVNDYITALNDGRKADAAMIAAKAAQYRAKHPTSGGPKTTITLDPESHKVQTQITYPGVDPGGEYLPNPKAGAQGSGASAKPTATSAQFFNSMSTVHGGEPGAPRDGGARTHKGRDYAGVKVGAPIPAPQNATLIDAGTQGNGGNYGRWKLADGSILSVAHLAQVPTAKSVRAGEALALAGNSGNASTRGTDRAVLHVRAWDRNGGEYDPQHMFAEQHNVAQPARRPVSGALDKIVQTAQAKGYRSQVTADGVVVAFPNGHQVLYDNAGGRKRLK